MSSKEWSTPNVNEILTRPQSEGAPKEKGIDVTSWSGTAIKINNKNQKAEPEAPEALPPDVLTPDDTMLTLNPNSVIATMEFRKYRERKARDTN